MAKFSVRTQVTGEDLNGNSGGEDRLRNGNVGGRGTGSGIPLGASKVQLEKRQFLQRNQLPTYRLVLS
ncbi:hypothetical protein JYU34_022688 [Plutella xylostella]|uniref:Uncharacterized protein n=1 Tax=Plutella xylostella TaxID=51655 RepID=A0ABQ7PPL9_PLUXY|nr:hypothetical protein JYU34_022688 [Plutella xylostella]